MCFLNVFHFIPSFLQVIHSSVYGLIFIPSFYFWCSPYEGSFVCLFPYLSVFTMANSQVKHNTPYTKLFAINLRFLQVCFPLHSAQHLSLIIGFSVCTCTCTCTCTYACTQWPGRLPLLWLCSLLGHELYLLGISLVRLSDWTKVTK